MKKLYFTLMFATAAAIHPLSAQYIQDESEYQTDMASDVEEEEDPIYMNFRFVYIAHEVTTPISELCAKLRTLREDADETGDVMIIYLSDGRTSLESFTNLPDRQGRERDTEQAYLEIIGALQDANYHNVVAQDDINNIIRIFDENNFISPTGVPKYADIIFDFYVGNNFWTLGNNEKVIAHIYHDFDMANLSRDIFHINIFTPRADHLRERVEVPFGDHNIDNINKHLRILEY